MILDVQCLQTLTQRKSNDNHTNFPDSTYHALVLFSSSYHACVISTLWFCFNLLRPKSFWQPHRSVGRWMAVQGASEGQKSDEISMDLGCWQPDPMHGEDSHSQKWVHLLQYFCGSDQATHYRSNGQGVWSQVEFDRICLYRGIVWSWFQVPMPNWRLWAKTSKTLKCPETISNLLPHFKYSGTLEIKFCSLHNCKYLQVFQCHLNLGRWYGYASYGDSLPVFKRSWKLLEVCFQKDAWHVFQTFSDTTVSSASKQHENDDSLPMFVTMPLSSLVSLSSSSCVSSLHSSCVVDSSVASWCVGASEASRQEFSMRDHNNMTFRYIRNISTFLSIYAIIDSRMLPVAADLIAIRWGWSSHPVAQAERHP